MLNEILMPEIRQIYNDMEVMERNCLEEERKGKHQIFRTVAELVLEMGNIARKEGLLALEEAGIGMESSQEWEMMKEMIMYIVDGTDPEVIEQLVLMKYFSRKKDAYASLADIMVIYGMLGIQAGKNPHILYWMMNNLLPADVAFEEEDSDLIYGRRKNVPVFVHDIPLGENPDDACGSKENAPTQDGLGGENSGGACGGRKNASAIDLDGLCRGGIRVRQEDKGYFEIKLCDEIIQALDDRAVQRVLRDIVGDKELVYLVNGFSGGARRKILTNLSRNNAAELAMRIHGEEDFVITGDWRLMRLKESADVMLKLLNKLISTAEIICPMEMYNNFLPLVMEHMDQAEAYRREGKKRCDMLIGMLERYKRSSFGGR